MIELIRTENGPAGLEAERVLEELVLAHQVTIVADTAPPAEDLPAIREGERVVSGAEEVRRYLTELRRFAALWSKFQSDSCYIDDDGTVC